MDKSSQEIATVDTKELYGKSKRKLSTARRITYLATLVAASLVFKMLGQALQFGSFKITVVYIPWIISAAVTGPLGGMVTCFATDLIGTFVLPTGGAPVPLLTVSNSLFGLIMGFAFRIPKIGYRLKTLIGTAAVLAVCTLGISAYALADLYSLPFWTEFVLRLPQALMVALNAAITLFLFPVMRKIKLLD